VPQEPTSATERIRRQIQETLAGHTRRFDEITGRFDKLDKRLDEHHEGIITALGMSANANVLHETVRREIEELRRRIQRLEEKA
jgi:uncharacterized coiled-coil DUF342 family protein